MDFRFYRQLLLILGFAIGPGLLTANEPAPSAAPAAAPAKDGAKPADAAAPEPILVLPTIQVSQSRIKQIDKEIVRLDKLIARENKKVKSSDLDKTLNNAQLAHAAAIFGGNSAEHLSAVAAGRVALLETERDVLEAMKRPATLKDLEMMKAELEQLRTTRRNLDNAERDAPH